MADLRKGTWLALVGVAVVIATGCTSSSIPRYATHLVVPARSSDAPVESPRVTASPAPAAPRPAAAKADTAPPGPAPVDPAPVVAGVRRSPGVVSAIVFDRAAGRYLLVEKPDRPFQSASLVKLLIALDALSSPPPDERTRARLRAMLSTSDDAVASQFWSAGGGGAIVRRMVAALQLSAAPPQPDRYWGYTSVTAQDMVTIYRHIMDDLAPADRELILSSLRAAPRIAADGYDQYFGVPYGLPGLPWAIKQGWSSGRGVVDVHSTGLVGAEDRYIVVLMTEQPAAVGWRTAMRLTTENVRLLAPLLT
jgi:hypothetical protein